MRIRLRFGDVAGGWGVVGWDAGGGVVLDIGVPFTTGAVFRRGLSVDRRAGPPDDGGHNGGGASRQCHSAVSTAMSGAALGHDHHNHDLTGTADQRSLLFALGLIGSFMVGELTAALFAHSLALIADAGHMLVDVGAVVAALAAARLSTRPATPTMTFGYRRSEILAATGNALTLIVMAAVLVVGAVIRLLHPPLVHGATVAAVGAIGVVVNVAATVVLGRADRSSLNVEAVVQHVATDAVGFIATVVAGIVIATTGFSRADSVASILVALLMIRAAAVLLAPAVRILAEATPSDIDLAEVRAHMLDLEFVDSVHDLHAWTVSSGLPVLSAHVVLSDACSSPVDTHRVLDQLQGCLSEHFDLEHSTFQLEVAGHEEHESEGHP
jgi:cobalt-zinc-cadmium efflux system protein